MMGCLKDLKIRGGKLLWTQPKRKVFKEHSGCFADISQDGSYFFGTGYLKLGKICSCLLKVLTSIFISAVQVATRIVSILHRDFLRLKIWHSARRVVSGNAKSLIAQHLLSVLVGYFEKPDKHLCI